MKKYLKNNEGMALPMVLIIMAILMTFATSLALFAYDSLLSVRWMSNEKRAYYLARAGVEAASYAYQVAATGSSDYNSSNINSQNNITRVVAAARDGAALTDGSAPVKSNTIYVYYKGDNGSGKFSGIEFKQSYIEGSPNYLGSFVVEIGKGVDLRQYRQDENSTFSQSAYDVVAFKCTAKCGESGDERTRVIHAYITETEGASKLKLYDDNGVLDPESAAFKEAPLSPIKIKLNTGDTSYKPDPNNNTTIEGVIQNINDFFKGLFKDMIIGVLGSEKTVQPYSIARSSSLILEAPMRSKTIKAPGTVIPLDNDTGVVDHLYVFQSAKNLFVKTGIEAVSEKTGFTAIGLYGDQIVIDGDITMDVYTTNPDSFWNFIPGAQNVAIVAAQRNFRIGTVILGCATAYGSCSDPLTELEGCLQSNDKKLEQVNKVFFNGNVNLKIYTQGAATQTYRVFNAGDIAYFYGCNVSVSGSQKDSDKSGGSKGIDLLRFFIDASLADLDGFKQNEATKRKLMQIKKLYYASDDSNYEPYVKKEGNSFKTILMRKIIVEETSKGFLVDGDVANIQEIIQPSEGAGAEIVWGRPRHGDVWNNFEKVS